MKENADVRRVLQKHVTLEIDHILKPDEILQIESLIRRELSDAQRTFPFFPLNPNAMISIVGEEFGESGEASIEFMWGRDPTTDAMRKELAQTAAMCIRAIGMLYRMERALIPDGFTVPEQISIERDGVTE